MNRKQIDRDYFGHSDQDQDDDLPSELHPVGDLFDDELDDEGDDE